MTNPLAWLTTRRSLRRYRTDPVPDPLIEQLLTAATAAPSAHNRQPWRFAVIGDPAMKEALALAMGAQLRADLAADGLPAETIEKDASRSYQRLTQAPLLILLCLTMADMDSYPDGRRQQNEWLMATQSVAMAGQNLLLAAHVLELGACWLCAPLFCPDVVRATLDLPADWQPQGLITVGYPAESREKGREPLASRVRFL
jgi:coenzyme F420-0:L-glutamate ligase / coenzyme F420-1:gamma-L-glutamate ligase